MTLQSNIYTMADEIIDRYGVDAGEHAEARLRSCLGDDDMLAAGVWLAIGNAIEDLTRLAAGETRH